MGERTFTLRAGSYVAHSGLVCRIDADVNVTISATQAVLLSPEVAAGEAKRRASTPIERKKG